jgi:hypothetical protein
MLCIAADARSAVLVPTDLDRPILRPQMPGEGLLEQRLNPFAAPAPRFGAEYTGWIDVRHPALSGAGDTLLGYDRYDRQFDQASTILTDENGILASSNVPRDLNHANRVYATQAGVSLIERQTRGYASPAAGNPGSFNFPLSNAEERSIMMQNIGGNRIDVYYARDLISGAHGETYSPDNTAGNNHRAQHARPRDHSLHDQ